MDADELYRDAADLEIISARATYGERLDAMITEAQNDPRLVQTEMQIRRIVAEVLSGRALAYGGIIVGGYSYQRFIIPIDRGPGRRGEDFPVFVPLDVDPELTRYIVERQVREQLAPGPQIARYSEDTGREVIHHAALPDFVPAGTRDVTYTVVKRAIEGSSYDRIERIVDHKLWNAAANIVMHALGWPRP